MIWWVSEKSLIHFIIAFAFSSIKSRMVSVHALIRLFVNRYHILFILLVSIEETFSDCKKVKPCLLEFEMKENGIFIMINTHDSMVGFHEMTSRQEGKGTTRQVERPRGGATQNTGSQTTTHWMGRDIISRSSSKQNISVILKEKYRRFGPLAMFGRRHGSAVYRFPFHRKSQSSNTFVLQIYLFIRFWDFPLYNLQIINHIPLQFHSIRRSSFCARATPLFRHFRETRKWKEVKFMEVNDG